MKKVLLIISAALILIMCGCTITNKNNLLLPEATGDKIFSTVGAEQESDIPKTLVHNGDGYSISVPTDNYRYEKDFDDGKLEEKWEHKRFDDAAIKVTTYNNSDEVSARSRFLREHDDYIFEDLLGYPLCGQEKDGDTLWFHLYEANEDIYIVSWEYPKNTDENLKAELSNIAGTFAIE